MNNAHNTLVDKLNSISWNLKRIADVLEEAHKDTSANTWRELKQKAKELGV